MDNLLRQNFHYSNPSYPGIRVYADEDYYMIIRNNSNAAITSGAWYLVGDVF